MTHQYDYHLSINSLSLFLHDGDAEVCPAQHDAVCDAMEAELARSYSHRFVSPCSVWAAPSEPGYADGLFCDDEPADMDTHSALIECTAEALAIAVDEVFHSEALKAAPAYSDTGETETLARTLTVLSNESHRCFGAYHPFDSACDHCYLRPACGDALAESLAAVGEALRRDAAGDRAPTTRSLIGPAMANVARVLAPAPGRRVTARRGSPPP